MTAQVDYEVAARQLLRAIRGKRSQVAFARRLGYRGNPITDWEHGRRYPTIHETLRACRRVGIDVEGAFARFHPSERLQADEEGADDIGRWLDALRGNLSLSALADKVEISRFAAARWVRGHARPRLPDFLRVADAVTGRVAELVAELVAIEDVPELLPSYEAVRASKRLAFEAPWTEAILRVLETKAYRSLPSHKDSFVAARLGIAEAVVASGISLLRKSGLVRRRSRRFAVAREVHVEIPRDPASLSATRAHWGRVIAERAPKTRDNEAFGYVVTTLREDQLGEVRQILRTAYREIRALVSDVEDGDVAAFVGLQLMVFDEAPDEPESR